MFSLWSVEIEAEEKNRKRILKLDVKAVCVSKNNKRVIKLVFYIR
jgi:hypothetical protein